MTVGQGLAERRVGRRRPRTLGGAPRVTPAGTGPRISAAERSALSAGGSALGASGAPATTTAIGNRRIRDTR